MFGGYGGEGYNRSDFNDLTALDLVTWEWELIETTGEVRTIETGQETLALVLTLTLTHPSTHPPTHSLTHSQVPDERCACQMVYVPGVHPPAQSATAPVSRFCIIAP